MKRVTKSELLSVYREHGLNGLWAYGRKHDIYFVTEVFTFGLASNKSSHVAKLNFLNSDKHLSHCLHLHYYSYLVSARHGNFRTNVLRGISVEW